MKIRDTALFLSSNNGLCECYFQTRAGLQVHNAHVNKSMQINCKYLARLLATSHSINFPLQKFVCSLSRYFPYCVCILKRVPFSYRKIFERAYSIAVLNFQVYQRQLFSCRISDLRLYGFSVYVLFSNAIHT